MADRCVVSRGGKCAASRGRLGCGTVPGATPRDERMSSIQAAVQRVAATDPHRVALVHDGCAQTYGELAAKSVATAMRLRSSGVGPGSRVGYVLEQSPVLVQLFLACAMLGATVVPLPPGRGRGRRSIAARASLSHVVVAADAVAEELRAWFGGHIHDGRDLAAGVQSSDPDTPPQRGALDEPLYWNLTSGSTRPPRAVAATQAEIWWNADSTRLALELDEGDTHYCAFPAHLHAHEVFARPLLTGARVLLAEPRIQYRATLDVLRECGVTRIHAAPVFYAALARGARSGVSLTHVRTAESGGMATPRWLLDLVGERLGIGLMPVWGSTETAGVALRCREASPRGQGCIGVAQPHYEVSTRPVAGTSVAELVVAGDAVARGYVDCMQEDRRSLPGDRTFVSGDLVASKSRCGYVLHGRRDDMVKVAGEQVFLGDVEHALREVSGVADAVVFPEADADRLITLVARVEREDGADLDPVDLRRACVARFPPHAVPREFRIGRVPRTATGKPTRAPS